MAVNPYYKTDLLPRVVGEGSDVWWLGGCGDLSLYEAVRRHSPPGATHFHNMTNAYLIIGGQQTLMVETGHSAHWPYVWEAIKKVLGDRPLDYIFPTHQEIPHAGNLGRLMDLYPGAVAVGDIRDLHLFFPKVDRSRLIMKRPGDSLNLGQGVVFRWLRSLWHDLPSTLWGFISPSSILFTVDALEYAHEHGCGQCGLNSRELGIDRIPESRAIGEFMRFVKMKPRVEALNRWVREFGAIAIAPSHGAPVVGNFPEVLAKLLEDAALHGIDASHATDAESVAEQA